MYSPRSILQNAGNQIFHKLLSILIIGLFIYGSLFPSMPTAGAVPLTDQPNVFVEKQNLEQVSVAGPESGSVPAPGGSAVQAPGIVQGLPVTAGLPGIEKRRTPNSTTYQTGENSYVTEISNTPINYLDSNGQWQTIQAAFQPYQDSYLMERNSIRSRAGKQKAWLSASVDQTAFVWEPTSLAVLLPAGESRTIATPLPQPVTPTQVVNGGSILNYPAGWSDPTISDRISAAPGSLEHTLILNIAPSSVGSPDSLELKTTLRLVPASSVIWADGLAQTAAFETQAGFEIRTADGKPMMAFEPVRAYEADAPANAVSGSYVFQPAKEPGVWQVSMRTPWSWWASSARRYPALIDPVIKVMKSTGYGDGLAWVTNLSNSTYHQNFTYGSAVMGLATHENINNVAVGYVQFNSMPAALSNAPVKIKGAYLDVTTGGPAGNWWRPGFTYKKGKQTDWAQVTVGINTSLSYIGACPFDPGCTNGFSLDDNSLLNTSLYNWTTAPLGTKVGNSLALLLQGPETNNYGYRPPITNTWNVTTQIAGWYDEWYDKTGARSYPTFRFAFDAVCPGGSFSGSDSGKIPYCFQVKLNPGDVRLRIEYDELPLSLGTSLLNKPGVPSYVEGVFDNTGHRYALQAPTGTHWRAIAARGNHDMDTNTPARVGLKLWEPAGSPPELADATTQSADETAFILMDDFNTASGISTANLQAEILSNNENNFDQDQLRNYRLDYVASSPLDLTPPSGSPFYTANFSISSDHLAELREFDLTKDWDLLMTVYVTSTLQVALAPPTTGSNRGDAILDNKSLIFPTSEVGTERTFQMMNIPKGGKWSLVLINQGRPVYWGEINGPRIYPAVVNFESCGPGSISTYKFGCQPIHIPSGLTTPHFYTRTWNGIDIYNVGDFTTIGTTTCTQNEGSGTPIIGPVQGGRYIFVGQGQVCFTSGTLNDQLTTSNDSAVGLAVPLPVDIGNPRGKGTILYGTTNQYMDGKPTGKLMANQVSGEWYLTPMSNTLKIIKPFDQYWKDETVHDYDRVSLARMKLEAHDVLTATVSYQADNTPETIPWDIDSSLYPNPAGSADPYTFDYQLDQQSPFPAVSLSSTELRIFSSWSSQDGLMTRMDSYNQPGQPIVYQFHAPFARLTLDASLGGATKDVQVVVQPPGFPRLPDGKKSCSYNGHAVSCLDVRRGDDYVWNNGAGEKVVAQWDLPDINISGTTGKVVFSKPGLMNIFSADHPDSRLATNGMDHEFSFNTWGAKVQITEESCVTGGPVVTVIRGKTSISLPMVGDDGSGNGAGVTATFKLCSNQLKQTSLSFQIPSPGIPLGNSGLGMYFIGGTVDIGQDSTTITMDVKMSTMDNVLLTNILGTVSIDTKGMFAFGGSGTVVGVLKGSTSIQVAWNPLDVLLQGELSYAGGFLSGSAMIHTWMGQGWQHKYPWLPDDSSAHFTGSIAATIDIPEGALIDELIFVLPPTDIYIKLEVAFGEFCSNSSCSNYEWGISGTVSVFGYDVGVYVSTSGPDLILGSNDHVLIDQYGTASLASASTGEIKPQAVQAAVSTKLPGSYQPYLMPVIHSSVKDWSTQAASNICTGFGTSTHDCSFTVNAGVGRALFVVSWLNGSLTGGLVNPHGLFINQDNASANHVEIKTQPTPNGYQTSYAVNAPSGSTLDDGVWKVEIKGIYTGTDQKYKNYYKVLFATDPPAPTLSWLNPVDQNTPPDSGGNVTLEWSASRGGEPLGSDTRMELFYAPAQPFTTTMHGIPITTTFQANQGIYFWQTDGLASGEYRVGARIDDHLNGNGSRVFWAPGSILIFDTTPPPAPDVFGKMVIDNGAAVKVTWHADTTTPDLAGYLVEYTIPSWDSAGTPLKKVRNVVPKAAPALGNLYETIRLGGMKKGFTTTVCVRAYDASGNVGDCIEHGISIGETPDVRLAGPHIESLLVDSSGALQIMWAGPSSSHLAGYFITYSPSGCMLPGPQTVATEGVSPRQYSSSTHQATLSGLTAGQTYSVTVYAYSDQGDISPGAGQRVLIIKPADLDHDGLPDEWETLYGLDGPGSDPDQDGLTNLQEYQQGSIPLYADSDNDGFYDNDEFTQGTNLCGPGSRPLYHKGPYIKLYGSSQLSFTKPTNETGGSGQSLEILNDGMDTLYWSASANQTWITLNHTNGSGDALLTVNVDQTGLAPGIYHGKITILGHAASGSLVANAPASNPLTETVEIPVTLVVQPFKLDVQYLPIVLR